MEEHHETAKGPKKRKAKTFPEKLMQAMTEFGDNEDAVAWLPDGKSFVIVSPDQFVKAVLTPVFKSCKYASFVRKLHRWGFARLTSGTGTDCFHHPLFQKSRKDLSARIVCTPRDKDSNNSKGNARFEKPPSLAGVERFIRAKAAAAAANKKNSPSPGDQQTTNPDMAVSAPSSISLEVPQALQQAV
jgi:hypothetical protein